MKRIYSFKKSLSIYTVVLTTVILLIFFAVFMWSLNYSIKAKSVVPDIAIKITEQGDKLIAEVIQKGKTSTSNTSVEVPSTPYASGDIAAFDTGACYFAAAAISDAVDPEIIKRSIIVGSFALALLLIITFIATHFFSKSIIRPLLVQVKEIVNHNETAVFEELLEIKEEYGKTYKNENKLIDEKVKYTTYTSHELRNFLTLLSTKVDVMGEEDPVKALEQVKADVERFKLTIDDLMAYENLSQKDIPLEEVSVDLAVAKEVDEYLCAGMDVQFDFDEDSEYIIMSRNSWIERATANLINNAIKYSADDRPVIVQLYRKDNTVILTVKNFGNALVKSEYDNIFKPYYSTNSAGKGLGLAFVKQIAEKSNGKVCVTSEDGATVFSVEFIVKEMNKV